MKLVSFGITQLDEPLTYKEAIQGEDAEKLKIAIKNQLDVLAENETWIEVDRPPDDRVIENKWVFKIKQNEEGNPCQYKARLVAKGFY